MHHRFAPKAHRFKYRMFLFALDLDELPQLHRRLRLFSVNRANLYSFRETDFCPTDEPQFPAPRLGLEMTPPRPAATLKQRVLNHLADHGIELRDGRVQLVTLPRIAGYLFNPVSFYFCFDRDGNPVASVAEVTNTFREVKLFTLTAPEGAADGRTAFHLRAPKHFYVSPFSDVDVQFDFTLRPPRDRLAVQIDDYVGASRTLTSTLTGVRRELDDGALARCTLKYPLLTLRIITLIHWHALQLWWKRLPWFAKAARRHEQRGLHRPHASLASPAQS